MHSLIVTVLLLLSNGKPSPHGSLTCEGMGIFGSDDAADAPEEVAQADSRGALVIEGPKGDYRCRAWSLDNRQQWQGTFIVDRDHATIRVTLH
jgi:hypothetical protein